jgi:hypothetical protein
MSTKNKKNKKRKCKRDYVKENTPPPRGNIT